MLGASALPWAIAGLAVALRMLALLVSADAGAPTAFEYEEIATNLLGGRGFTAIHNGTVYRSLHSAVPYVWLNAIVCGLTGHRHLALLIVQSICTGVLVLVIFRIGAQMFDRPVGGLAALLTATHPGLLAYDTRLLHSLSLDALLSAAGVLAVMSLTPGTTPTRRFMTGVVLALGVFERGTLIALAVLGPLWMARHIRPSLRGTARYVLPVALGIVVTLAPWVIRNVVIHRTLVMMTTSGEHFWRGNHPAATGTAYRRDGREAISNADAHLVAQINAGDELAQMRAFTRAGLAFWRESPAEAALLYARKIVYFFAATPTAGARYPSWAVVAYLVYYAICALVALTSVRALWRRWRARGRPQRGVLLPVLCILSVGIVQAIFYVETRHRWAVEPLILTFTAAGALETLRQLRYFRDRSNRQESLSIARR